MICDLTQDDVKRLFDYDDETGDLIWRKRDRSEFTAGRQNGEAAWKIWNSRNAGQKIRNLNTYGYLRVAVSGKRYFAHRIIWLWVHGEWPEGEIDHINGNRADNRIENLRVVDRQGNTRNLAARSDNTSGVTGVSYAKRDGVYLAYITVDKKVRVLGRFDSFDDAVAARKAAEKKHGFHPNHGRSAA